MEQDLGRPARLSGRPGRASAQATSGRAADPVETSGAVGAGVASPIATAPAIASRPSVEVAVVVGVQLEDAAGPASTASPGATRQSTPAREAHRVLLAGSPGAESPRGDAHRARVDVGHDAVARRHDDVPARRDRQRGVGVAALGARSSAGRPRCADPSSSAAAGSAVQRRRARA